jgi:hypothetical protein
MPMCERNQLSSGNRVRFSANAANLSSELSEHARQRTTAAHSPDGWNAAVSTVRAADRDDACAKVSICPSAALTRDPRARQLHSRKASGSCRPPAEPDDNGQSDRQQVEAPVKSKAPCSEAPLRCALTKVVRHPVVTHPVVRHPVVRHPVVRHPVVRHPVVRHPVERHPVVRHPGVRLLRCAILPDVKPPLQDVTEFVHFRKARRVCSSTIARQHQRECVSDLHCC